MGKRFTGYDCIFVVLFIYLFILQIQAIWPFTIDDMYISLRYARHWAAGDGLLWNLHAPTVEGYSNFSFVALGAALIILKLNPVIVLKAVGIVGLFFTCLSTYLISRLWLDWRQSLLPCIGLLVYKGQIIWTASGLETAAYQALLCGTVFFIFKGLGYQFFPDNRGEPKPFFLVLSGLLLSLASMTRPEAPSLMALFFILICWDKPNSGLKKHRKALAFFTLTIALIYLPYFFWRGLYYGHLFANPVYCKGISSGSSFFLDVTYLKLIWPFALLSLPACMWAKDKRHYFLWMPSLVYLTLLAASDPVVGFYNRLFLPAFVLLLPLAFQGISQTLLSYLKQRDTLYCYSFYVVAFFIGFFFIPGMTLSEYHFFTQNPLAGEELRGRVVQWLSHNVASGDWVVLADSGMIPYYSDLNFIDSYCLNNVTMAHYPEKKRYTLFCKKMWVEKPRVLILTSLIEHGEVIYTPADRCLKRLINKQTHYKLAKIFSSKNPDSIYQYELFIHF